MSQSETEQGVAKAKISTESEIESGDPDSRSSKQYKLSMVFLRSCARAYTLYSESIDGK